MPQGSWLDAHLFLYDVMADGICNGPAVALARIESAACTCPLGPAGGDWSASPTQRSLSPTRFRLTGPVVDGNVSADVGICRTSFPGSAVPPVARPLRKRFPAAPGLQFPVGSAPHRFSRLKWHGNTHGRNHTGQPA